MPFRKPMLAKSFEKHERRAVYPCFAQTKVDGIHCVTDGMRFWSKNGKRFPAQNVKHLRMPGLPYLVNGELTLEGGHADFEEIVSVVKRVGHQDRKYIQFNVFDVVIPDMPYEERYAEMKRLFKRLPVYRHKSWRLLPAHRVANRSALRQQHRKFLRRGYEGTMIRNAHGLYVSKRSVDLLKWKPLKDKEFKIVTVKQAKGKDTGTPVFICRAGRRVFACRPMGTMAQRRKMWRHRKRLIGKMLTVQYQNLTKYGVPRFPRAKVIRDYE